MIDQAKNRFLLEEQLTIVSTQTLHKIFKIKYGADAIALYMFYYYTAKWQKTNQPKATNSFCLNGLGWGAMRFRRAKRILRNNDLIEDVFAKDKKGKITGWYIKINYLWKNKTIQRIKTTPLKKLPSGKKETNALSDNKIKCLKCNNIHEQKDVRVKVYKRLPKENQTMVHRLCYHLEDLLDTKIVNWGKQGSAIKRMIRAGYTEEQIKRTITYMAKNDDFFADKGFDLITVSNAISRYKGKASAMRRNNV